MNSRALSTLRLAAAFLFAFSAHLLPCKAAPDAPKPPTTRPTPIPTRCTPEWKQLVDRRLGIRDAQGHGPEIGSAEWMAAVGKKSGVIDAEGHGPDPGSDEWCRAVDFKVFGRR